MAFLLGIDTGGTYTDAVLLDDDTDTIVARAKALTTRPDLSKGIGAAMDDVLRRSNVEPADVAMVSLSTTLATNALIEGQGGRVGLVFIGFEEAELNKADLSEALGDVIPGHSDLPHAGLDVSEALLSRPDAAELLRKASGH